MSAVYSMEEKELTQHRQPHGELDMSKSHI